jgi:hypothetical protein
MTRHNLFPTLAAIVVLLAVGSAYAQNIHVVADVPFGFMLENRSLPAGHYEIQAGPAQGVVGLRRGAEHIAFLMTNDVRTVGSTKSKLVFQRYGDRYFLRQVWMSGSDSGRELPAGKLEKELASIRKPASVAVIASK